MVLKVDETAEQAVPLVSKLYRRNHDDPILRRLRVQVTERRRQHAVAAETEGRLDDAAGAWWDVLHLNPHDDQARVRLREVRRQMERSRPGR